MAIILIDEGWKLLPADSSETARYGHF